MKILSCSRATGKGFESFGKIRLQKTEPCGGRDHEKREIGKNALATRSTKGRDVIRWEMRGRI